MVPRYHLAECSLLTVTQALELVWVIGHIFMSFAAQKFNEFRQVKYEQQLKNPKVKPYYLDWRYDLKFIFTPVDASSNILLYIINAFIGMLNHTVHLPKHLIILLDEDFIKITAGYRMIEKTIGFIVGHNFQEISKCKKQLPDKAYRSRESKIIFGKPSPTKNDQEDVIGGRNQRRIFNRSLEVILGKYDSAYTFNADEIQLNKQEFYKSGKSHHKLSPRGYKAYWHSMNEVVQRIDTNRILPLKEYIKLRDAKEAKEWECEMNKCTQQSSYNKK